MIPAIDMTGQRVGRLLVLERAENGRHRGARWLCRCDCSATSIVMGGELRRGTTTSCGCRQRETASALNLSHGHRRGGGPTTEYSTWTTMLQRCSNTKSKDFKDYGGRGITVCDAWRASFQAFLDDMGPKPSPDLTLDRIKNDGNYEPSNCRWATWSEQRRNQRPAARKGSA